MENFRDETPLRSTIHFIKRCRKRYNNMSYKTYIEYIPFVFKKGKLVRLRKRKGKYGPKAIGMKYKKVFFLFDPKIEKKEVTLVTTFSITENEYSRPKKFPFNNPFIKNKDMVKNIFEVLEENER